jgi:DNA-binding response OmpR family regulator
MMPKLDGNEFCAKIKVDERTSHIPVILLTARASKEDRLESLETGADDFITKPFDPEELTIRVKNLIQQRNSLREHFLKKFIKSDFNPFPQLTEYSITSTDEKFLQKAYKIVEDHIDDSNFTVEEFVTEMAMSQVQLYRKLKAVLNLSASEFIRTLRLNHGARLIKEKAGNIAQISYAVGFNNPSYFAECFKKQFGVSPSKFNI